MQRVMISAAVARLSIYHRILVSLEAGGEENISSAELGTRAGFNAAQVRKDFASFESLGCPGKGYDVRKLRTAIGKMLGKEKRWKVALIGAGNLGKALLSYAGFKAQGFDIIEAFDADRKKIGTICGDLSIKDIACLVPCIKKQSIDIAIIAVPAQAAQGVTDLLLKAGIKAILNFAPALLTVNKNVKLHNVDLSVELDKLSHLLSLT